MGDSPGPLHGLAMATPPKLMCNPLDHSGLGGWGLTGTGVKYQASLCVRMGRLQRALRQYDSS